MPPAKKKTTKKAKKGWPAPATYDRPKTEKTYTPPAAPVREGVAKGKKK